MALATGQTGLATLMLLPVVLLTGIRPTGPVTLEVVLAMVSLGALGSGIAYVLNFHVVARAGATTASSVTYLTPLVATVVGVTFLGEHVTWNEPVGAVVVLVGVAVSQGRLLRRR